MGAFNDQFRKNYDDIIPFGENLLHFMSVHSSAVAHLSAVFIGPEGDFSPTEYEHLAASSHQPVSFGPLILRSETAALFALSALHVTF